MSAATYQAQYRKDRYLTGYRRLDATGTRRRLQGLMRLGWSLKQISAETGLDQFWLSTISRGDVGDRVNRRTADLVAGWAKTHCHPAPDTPTSRRIRSRAVNRGYLSLLAWDDLDDATETPSEVADARQA